jgi:hypothetical protein
MTGVGDHGRSRSAFPTRRLRVFVWVLTPAMFAGSLWAYRLGGAGQDKSLNAAVLSGVGLVLAVVLELRERLCR